MPVRSAATALPRRAATPKINGGGCAADKVFAYKDAALDF